MELQVLAERGVDGYRQYRIPSMAVTPSGRVVAIYDGRPNFDDLPSPVDLVIRFSDDNGISWSDQKVFREHYDISGYGDASIIIDPNWGDRGRILVFSQLTHEAGFFESKAGCDENDPLISQVHLSISDDDGESWTHRLITRQLKTPEMQGIFATSGAGVHLKSGRLLQSFVVRKNDTLSAVLGYSDDHGENWKLGATIPEGNESAVTELSNGNLLVHTRSNPYRRFGYSNDQGLTLSDFEDDRELPDSSCNGSLITLKDGSVIASHTHDKYLRRNIVLKRSFDNGATWPEALIVEESSAAYSTIYELTDGSIGVLFERNGYSEIVFARIGVHEFKPSQQVLQEEHDVVLEVVLRNIRPVIEETLDEGALRRVPEAKMSQYKSQVRKEVGAPEGNASGEVLYTTLELNEILGLPTPGWHIGDEVRWSGRLTNNSTRSISEVSVVSAVHGEIGNEKTLAPGETLVFLDIRDLVTPRVEQEGELAIQLTARFLDNGHETFQTFYKSFKVRTGQPLS